MATFTCNDIDGFVLSMKEFAELPDDTIGDILEAGAEVVRKAHVEAISHFGQHTGRLLGSPKIKMCKRGRSRYALIYPDGTHHTYHARKGGTATARNADVGFVQEFGGHGNTKHLGWMMNANEKSAEETTRAEADVYDRWLKTLNL
ncbi:MAG: hypothetical protein IJV30_02150 [Oscillospiraceae bacterium]|nr:hypothetical protein [Clostridium sp.]MBQ7436111.1 hypothetical protein [Oscillospiraceae bacterium]